MRYTFIFVIMMLLSGCTAVPIEKKATKTDHLFLDDAFALESLPDIESQQQIFELSDDAKRFVDQAIAEADTKQQRVKAITTAIFDRSQLGLMYDNSATSTANQTFLTSMANCLSMTIMTYSMMMHADLETWLISVDVPEYWTRRDGFSLINGHVNLKVRTDNEIGIAHFRPSTTVIDFDPQNIRRFFGRKPVNKNQITGLFYNNKAAGALINGQYDLAYKYLKAATHYAPTLDDSWLNLGVLYRFKGHYAMSERAYRHVLTLKPDNYTAMENMAILYRVTGRKNEADRLQTRVKNARKNNPFYHFILGEEARDNGEFEAALSHYRRALKLDKSKHEIYFGLGSTLYELGDMSNAKMYLNKAARVAPHDDDKQRYLGKLSVLQTQLKPRQAL